MRNIIFIIAAFLLFAPAAFAQGSIEGTITDAKGKGIANVTVTVVGANGKPVATVKTDADGMYTFDEIAAGIYKVVATTPSGYKPAFRDDIAVEDDDATTLDITLVAAVQAPVPKPTVKPVTPTPTVQPPQPTKRAEPAKGLVDEIIGKHITAIGGKQVIGRIQSVYMEIISEAMGDETKVFVTILNGKGYRTESDFRGSKFIQCFTDSLGWEINPLVSGAVQTIPSGRYESGRWQIHVGGELFDYTVRGGKAELLGKEGNLYKIRLTTRDYQVSTYYIDSSTYFVNKVLRSVELQGQQGEVTVSHYDYKKTDFGFVVPYTTEMVLGQFTQIGKVVKVEINKPVDPKIFEMPK